MQPPPACRQLKDWLLAGRKFGRSQKWLAKALDTSQPTVYRWLSGENRPDLTYRIAIYHLTKHAVRISAWFYPKEMEIAHRFKTKEARKAAGGGCS